MKKRLRAEEAAKKKNSQKNGMSLKEKLRNQKHFNPFYQNPLIWLFEK